MYPSSDTALHVHVGVVTVVHDDIIQITMRMRTRNRPLMILVDQNRSSSVICLDISIYCTNSIRSDPLDNVGVFDHCCEFLEIQFPVPIPLARFPLKVDGLCSPILISLHYGLVDNLL